MGRLVTTGPLPGSETYVAGGESEKIELSAISDCGLDEVDWLVEEIPRLSTKGTRRALVSNFQDMFIDTVPVAVPETLGEKWNLGPNDNSRWHPDGACLRFQILLVIRKLCYNATERVYAMPFESIVIKEGP